MYMFSSSPRPPNPHFFLAIYELVLMFQLSWRLTAVLDSSSWLRDKLMGSYIWPIAAPLIAFALTLPCMALVWSDERPNRILRASSSLCTAILSVYLSIVHLVRARNGSLVTVFINSFVSLAVAITAVILAKIDGHYAAAAVELVPLFLGVAQSYLLVTIQAARNLRDADG